MAIDQLNRDSHEPVTDSQGPVTTEEGISIGYIGISREVELDTAPSYLAPNFGLVELPDIFFP